MGPRCSVLLAHHRVADLGVSGLRKLSRKTWFTLEPPSLRRKGGSLGEDEGRGNDWEERREGAMITVK